MIIEKLGRILIEIFQKKLSPFNKLTINFPHQDLRTIFLKEVKNLLFLGESISEKIYFSEGNTYYSLIFPEAILHEIADKLEVEFNSSPACDYELDIAPYLKEYFPSLLETPYELISKLDCEKKQLQKQVTFLEEKLKAMEERLNKVLDNNSSNKEPENKKRRFLLS